MYETATFKIFSPVIWLAAVAFMVGFISYLALGGGVRPLVESRHASAALVSGPASGAWTLPRQI